MGKIKRPCFYGDGVPQLLLLLLLLTLFPYHKEGGGGVRVTEARICLSRSHYFHELCKSNHKCSLVCRYDDGFTGDNALHGGMQQDTCYSTRN